jgi:hypothetical protein
MLQLLRTFFQAGMTVNVAQRDLIASTNGLRRHDDRCIERESRK